jgi:hypothetical protein
MKAAIHYVDVNGHSCVPIKLYLLSRQWARVLWGRSLKYYLLGTPMLDGSYLLVCFTHQTMKFFHAENSFLLFQLV